MGRRILSFLLALWWLAWVAFIVPVHTRGAIGLDGTLARDAKGAAVPLFFASLPPCCQPKSPTDSKVPPRSAGNCAICQVVAQTGITPAVSFTFVFVALQHIGLLPSVPQVASADFLPTFQGRAPPRISLL